MDVVCVGAATLDTVLRIATHPGEDTRTEAEEVVESGGGPAATAAATMARLGLEVAFCGTVGRDSAGRRVREGLDSAGVDTRWLTTQDDAATAVSTILVSASGTRTIITRPGVPPQPGPEVLAAAPWMHVDQLGHDPVRRCATQLGAGPRLSVDGGNPIPGLTLDGVDLYAPTLTQLRARHPGTATVVGLLTAARHEGAELVVATDGAAGSHVVGPAPAGSGPAGDQVAAVPAFTVDPVSTLGAGDVFHGALLAALLHGLPPVGATTYASAAAALSCRALDGRGALPDETEVHDFLLRHPCPVETAHAC